MKLLTTLVRFLQTVAVPVVLLVAFGRATAQQSPEINWAVLAGGGVNNAASTDFRMSATLGQPVIGLTGDQTIVLGQGFWLPLGSISSVPFDFKSPDAPFALRNYPNPFTVLTTISYQLDEPALVGLEVVDLAGRVIATFEDEYRSAGNHNVEWNGMSDRGEPAPAGIYVYALHVRGAHVDKTSRQKMMLVR